MAGGKLPLRDPGAIVRFPQAGAQAAHELVPAKPDSVRTLPSLRVLVASALISTYVFCI